MKDNSQDYSVYIPESGHPLSGVSRLSCGDLVQVSNSINGLAVETSGIRTGDNASVPIHRFFEFSSSELDVSVPEQIATDLQKMRRDRCMLGAQRRKYCDGLPEKVFHYGWLTLSSASLANGTSVRDREGIEVPTSTFRGVFGIYQEYDNSPPKVYFREGWNPVQVEYCDFKNCSPCDSIDSDGCDIVFALWVDDAGVNDLQISTDGGDSFGTYNSGISIIADPVLAIHCFQGCLLVAQDSSNPNVNLRIIQDAIRPSGTPPEIFVGSTTSSDSPFVTHLVSSGNVVYAAWNGGDQIGVDRSIDGGFTWDTIFVDDEVINALSAIGSVLAIAFDDEIAVIRDNGNESSVFEVKSAFELISKPDGVDSIADIALALPDYTKRDCPSIYIVGNNSKVYVTVGEGDRWESVFSDDNLCAEPTKPYIRTSNDGFGVWFHRAHISQGKAITFKNFGRGLDCDWLNFQYDNEVCLDCGTENTVTSCTPISDNIFTVELSNEQQAGQVTVCLDGDVYKQGYIFASSAVDYNLTIFSEDEVFSCGQVLSINCVQCFGYPCKSWQTTAFAVCDCDPNTAIILAGSSCPPSGVATGFIVKGVTTEGTPTELVSKTDVLCLPEICE